MTTHSKIAIVETKNLSKCPASQLPYWGACPNTGCPSNISKYHTEPSGCLLQVTPHPTVQDISRVLRILPNDAQRLYDDGIKLAERFIKFYNWLEHVREVRSVPLGCSVCGVFTRNGTDCLSIKRCARRAKFITRQTGRFPMNLTPLRLTDSEFWAIVLAQNHQNIEILPKRVLRRANKLIAHMPLPQ